MLSSATLFEINMAVKNRVFSGRIKNFKNKQFCILRFSGLRRDVDEICALLAYYATSSGNLLPTFR
jgi:hypothetical protein